VNPYNPYVVVVVITDPALSRGRLNLLSIQIHKLDFRCRQVRLYRFAKPYLRQEIHPKVLSSCRIPKVGQVREPTLTGEQAFHGGVWR
jgi:hypothetical protein